MFRRNVPDAQVEFLKYDEVASASPLWASLKALVAKGQINEAIIINKNLNSQWSLGENYNNMGKQYFYAKQYNNVD